MSAKFGPAGNSDSFSQVHKSSLAAPRWIADLGLDCYEYQCGKGVNVGEETARKVGQAAAEAGITLSLHAPYFINLANPDPGALQKTIGYITAACRALVLNLGMLSPRKLEAMVKSGHQANRMGIPVVLDPVGAGASALRTRAAYTLLEEVRFAAVRGNGSEIRVLAAGGENHGGVDAAPGECAPEQERAMAEALARRIHAVVAVTGETDLVTNGARAARCLGGCAEMGLVTGTGCMLSALTGALLAASPEQPFAAVCTAVCAMKTAGELARAALAPDEGWTAPRWPPAPNGRSCER